MIVTVTLNPAIDKTIAVDRLVYQGLNRIQSVETDIGGKGINVSKTIAELGGKSVATGFLGGHNGQMIDRILKEQGIFSDFVWVAGETRTNTKVVEADGALTELNEPGIFVDDESVQMLKEKLSGYASEDTIFVFAGSIPQGVTTEIYKELIGLVKKKSAYVIIDADGEVFSKALDAKPNVVKPNQMELEAFCDMKKEATVDELVDGAKEIQQKGIEQVVVSMGRDGAIFLMGRDVSICESIPVPVSSSVGAGDAMVAALAYGKEQQLQTEEIIRLCMAVSAGAVTTKGTKPPKKELVCELLKKVHIEKIK